MKTTRRFTFLAVLWLAVTIVLLCAGTVFASDDNSLSDLGITTQGATVSPDFRYDIWEYSVQVPAGTQELELTPRATNPGATINSVSGTTLNEDGTGKYIWKKDELIDLTFGRVLDQLVEVKNQLQFLKKKSNQFLREWVWSMSQCMITITLVTLSVSSKEHLKVPKVRFSQSIRPHVLAELKPSSSEEQLQLM